MAKSNSIKRALSGFSVPLPNLPEDVITEILLKLPVKSLLKFRCVSKSWLSLISSPQFIKAHLEISTKNNMNYHNTLVFGSRTRPFAFCTLSLHHKIDENMYRDIGTKVFDFPLSNAMRVVGSCNGLVCVAVDGCGVALWNPATRKSKKLPVSDPWNKLAREYGYGYDAINDDYKVVEFSWINRFRGRRVLYETRVKVYSSRADSWRSVEWPSGEVFDGPGVFMKGAIHWKVCYDNNMSNWVVMAQNVTTEACSIVELPMIASNDAKVMLGASGGWLCASYDYFSYMDVWVMKEYGVQESWIKLVSFPYLFCMEHPNYGRPRLLFASENGGILVKLGSDLVMYKPPQCHEILSLRDRVEAEAVTYDESLLSPDFDRLACR